MVGIKISSKGRHFKYRKNLKTVIIPLHGNRDIPIGTLKRILKDAGLSEDDLV